MRILSLFAISALYLTGCSPSKETLGKDVDELLAKRNTLTKEEQVTLDAHKKTLDGEPSKEDLKEIKESLKKIKKTKKDAGASEDEK
jgi:hypothetical protein